MSAPPHSAALRLSVVICTLNRASILPIVLRALRAQDANEDDFEVIVVDNGSTDDTPGVVTDAQKSTPHLRYVREPRIGLSHARNTGIRESRGASVAFLDDDAEPSEVWVSAMLSAYDDQTVGAVGGRIEVAYPGGRPDWVPLGMEGYYGHFDYGDERCSLEYPHYPFGGNMSILRSLLIELRGFSPRLGLQGRRYLAAEETDFFFRLSSLGTKVVYEPRARVRHHVPPDHLRRLWYLRRAKAHGESVAILRQLRAGGSRLAWAARGLRGAPKASLALALAAALSSVGGSPARATARWRNACYLLGFARGCFGNAMAPHREKPR